MSCSPIDKDKDVLSISGNKLVLANKNELELPLKNSPRLKKLMHSKSSSPMNLVRKISVSGNE